MSDSRCNTCKVVLPPPPSRGPKPVTCKDCLRVAKNERRRRPGRGLIECADCSVAFDPTGESGRFPERCPACKVARKKATDSEKSRRWRERNPDAQRETQRRSYEKRKGTPGELAIRARARLKAYGLTPDELARMVEAQGNRCAICGEEPTSGPGRRLHVDHCHTTGKVRALLCNFCNHVIGQARERPEILRAAAEYIEKHREVDS